MDARAGRLRGKQCHAGHGSLQRLRSIGCWLLLVICCLNHLYSSQGRLGSLIRCERPPNRSQEEALRRIRVACERFVDRTHDDTGEAVRSPIIGFGQVLGRKRLSYGGGEVSMPEALTLEELLFEMPVARWIR